MAGVRIVSQTGLFIYLIYLYLPLIKSKSTELLFERVDLKYVNEKYITNMSLYVRRIKRNSPYYLMGQGTTLVWLGDNVTAHGVFYEYLHNEYKRSFVEINLSLCDVWTKQPWRSALGDVLASNAMKCPIPPRTYKMNNVTLRLTTVDSVWPFEKAMMEGFLKIRNTGEVLVRVHYYITVKRDTSKN